MAILSPTLWRDFGYGLASAADQNDILDFNLSLGIGVEVLAVRHIFGTSAIIPDDTVMALAAEITLDLGATQVGVGALDPDMFENTQAIWNDIYTYSQNFTTSGAAGVFSYHGPDWRPPEPIIVAQNLNVVVSFIETTSGSVVGNIRVYFRFISLSDTDLVRLLSRGRFR